MEFVEIILIHEVVQNLWNHQRRVP